MRLSGILKRGGVMVLAIVIGTSMALANEEPPTGYLARKLFGETLEKDFGTSIFGWAQGGLIYNDNGSQSVSPQGFFNQEEGFNLNQLGLMVCKGNGCPPFVQKPTQNVLGRIGPLPGPRPDNFQWGYNVTAVYGQDVDFLKTLGVDDWSFDENNKDKLALTQWFLDLYFPFLGGTDLLLGSWQTSLANDIGYPFTPPNWFYTHTYAFMHGPAKHVGALLQTKLPIPENLGLLSIEFGPVLGWNNLKNENNDLSYIAGLRWRSSDMRTWIDIETIYGNGENDFGPGPATGGSPYFALSSTEESLDRFTGFLVITHAFTDKFQTALEATYGTQEAGDIAPAPIFITEDATWKGINLAFRYMFRPGVAFNLRGEWFDDEQGAHVLLAGSPGDIYSVTTNVTWDVNKFLKIRPELRYDTYDGDGLPAFADKTEDSQLLGSIDVVFLF